MAARETCGACFLLGEDGRGHCGGMMEHLPDDKA